MHRISVLTMIAALGLPAAADDQTNLAARLWTAESERDAKVKEVRSVRRYTLRNSRWKSDATMQAIMTTSVDGKKRYEVLHTNAEGLRKKILLKILDGEVEAATREARNAYVNATNYEVRLLPSESPDNQSCRPVDLIAKNRSRFTLDGRGCVDMNDMAMVHMEGRTAKKISFWIGRADVAHDFRKVGEFWYVSRSRSTANVKLLGKTELVIDYLEYTITPKTGAIINSCRTGVNDSARG
jgi:hypothetical protein